MAGADSRDNPIALNVVPMVDVIFCLCVFFMCSTKFGQAEGKFDVWLPKDRGAVSAGTSADEPLARIAIYWDDSRKAAIVQLGHRVVRDDTELEGLLREAREDTGKRQRPEAHAVLDAEGRVPWGEVVAVVNLCRRVGIQDVRFALSGPDPAPK
jgi:biopolymer transport protein ExbD